MRLGQTAVALSAWLVTATAIAQTWSPATAPPAEQSVLALNSDAIYTQSLAALTMLFVVAVLLESAFSTIFNWRVFLTYFSLTGVKTLIMVAISLVVVVGFDIDILANLIAAYKTSAVDPAAAPALREANVDAVTGPTSKFITALILAGGSAGVYNLMSALGYRSNRREEEVAARPPKDSAWVAVRVNRQQAVGEIFVKIRETDVDPKQAPAPIAGTIGGRRPSLKELLFRNANRYPQNGGHTLSPNAVYAITVEGKDRDGGILKRLDGERYVFAPGAVVDFEVTL